MEGESSVKCRACGSNEPAIWDSDTGNAVCPSCGTVDETQRLVSGEYYAAREQNGYHYGLEMPQGSTANSYAIRIKGAEWHLQNHLREHRQLISKICASLEFHGRDRAIHHFEAAMANGDYRWGRESKLVCAVAIAIAMVEEKKPEPIPRIAELIEESPSAILRQWTLVLSTLDLHIRPTSPLLLLAMLYGYLLDAIEPPSLAPLCIINTLSSPTSFSLSSVLQTAERIAAFFGLTNTFALLPSAPTACGIFLIAIETEKGHALSISTASTLAEFLGRRFSVKGSTVLSRRRSMMMVFSEWAALIPWASVPTFNPDGSRNLWTVNKMSAIVRCVEDVLQFQYELSNKRGVRHEEEEQSQSQTQGIEGDDEPPSEPQSRSRSPPATTPVETTNTPHSPLWWTALKGRKHPRGAVSAQRMISMLLQPSSTGTHKLKLPPLDPTEDPRDVQERLSRIELHVLYGADNNNHHHHHHQRCWPLTRLQALALQRGGVENISDDELFEPGELESYQNAEEDAQLLGASHPEWWDIVEQTTTRGGPNRVEPAAEKRGGGKGNKRKGRGKGKVAKRSKADKVPLQVRYSDEDEDEDGEGDNDGDEEGGDETMELDEEDTDHQQRHSSRSRRPRSSVSSGKRHPIAREEEEEGIDFVLGKEAYLGFGVFPGWEGDDPDTVRYFECMG